MEYIFAFLFVHFSKFGGRSKSDDEDAVDPVINIFSLASGHLYERFLRCAFYVVFSFLC